VLSSLHSTRKNAYGFGGTTIQATGKRKIFDDELLAAAFPKQKMYHETAPKRKYGEPAKARGFAWSHGTRIDESGSEEER
jgi:hypothetical protein